MKPYEKTQNDIKREENDLKSNAVMRWILNQDVFKFNVGDILIKKTRVWRWDPHAHPLKGGWETEVINSTTNAPKKYIYAFENKLGIGYLRQLKVSGDGYCDTLICVANFDPDNTRFELDPDFVDHTLLGEGEFTHNQEYLSKKKFREEAIAANRKILEKTSSKKGLRKLFLGFKPGDILWYGDTFDQLSTRKYIVKEIIKAQKPAYLKDYTDLEFKDKKYNSNNFLEEAEWQLVKIEVLEHDFWKPGDQKILEISSLFWAKVSLTQPHPLKDQLCGPQK
jgi:hypothetical protein